MNKIELIYQRSEMKSHALVFTRVDTIVQPFVPSSKRLNANRNQNYSTFAYLHLANDD